MSEFPNRRLGITNSWDDKKNKQERPEEKILFGRFVCDICLDAFVKKNFLEARVKDMHQL